MSESIRTKADLLEAGRNKYLIDELMKSYPTKTALARKVNTSSGSIYSYYSAPSSISEKLFLQITENLEKLLGIEPDLSPKDKKVVNSRIQRDNGERIFNLKDGLERPLDLIIDKELMNSIHISSIQQRLIRDRVKKLEKECLQKCLSATDIAENAYLMGLFNGIKNSPEYIQLSSHGNDSISKKNELINHLYFALESCVASFQKDTNILNNEQISALALASSTLSHIQPV